MFTIFLAIRLSVRADFYYTYAIASNNHGIFSMCVLMYARSINIIIYNIHVRIYVYVQCAPYLNKCVLWYWWHCTNWRICYANRRDIYSEHDMHEFNVDMIKENIWFVYGTFGMLEFYYIGSTSISSQNITYAISHSILVLFNSNQIIRLYKRYSVALLSSESEECALVGAGVIVCWQRINIFSCYWVNDLIFFRRSFRMETAQLMAFKWRIVVSFSFELTRDKKDITNVI